MERTGIGSLRQAIGETVKIHGLHYVYKRVAAEHGEAIHQRFDVEVTP